MVVYVRSFPLWKCLEIDVCQNENAKSFTILLLAWPKQRLICCCCCCPWEKLCQHFFFLSEEFQVDELRWLLTHLFHNDNLKTNLEVGRLAGCFFPGGVCVGSSINWLSLAYLALYEDGFNVFCHFLLLCVATTNLDFFLRPFKNYNF